MFFLSVFTVETWRLEDTLATLNARYNKKVFLEMFVWPDDRDSSRHIIHVEKLILGIFVNLLSTETNVTLYKYNEKVC